MTTKIDTKHRAILKRLTAIEKRLTTIERKVAGAASRCRTARQFSIRGRFRRG